MGKRYLVVHTDLFVELLKTQQDRKRNLIVEDGIPDDSKVIGIEVPDDRGEIIRLVLESSAWMGDSSMPLDAPSVTIEWKEPVAHGQTHG
jgi:hypothetical protein